MSDSQESMPELTPGTFCWNELISPFAAASASFYQALFGWSVEEMPMGSGGVYRMFKIGDRPVGGLFETDGGPTQWTSYVAVEDIDAATARAAELGATICKGVTDIGMGKLSVITDPQGGTFALWQRAAG